MLTFGLSVLSISLRSLIWNRSLHVVGIRRGERRLNSKCRELQAATIRRSS
jgi:hypothetical protein